MKLGQRNRETVGNTASQTPENIVLPFQHVLCSWREMGERKHGSGPRPSSQHNGDLFALEGKRAGNKRQRQRRKGKGTRERGKGCLFRE